VFKAIGTLADDLVARSMKDMAGSIEARDGEAGSMEEEATAPGLEAFHEKGGQLRGGA
jgi:hypothetical protein